MEENSLLLLFAFVSWALALYFFQLSKSLHNDLLKRCHFERGAPHIVSENLQMFSAFRCEAVDEGRFRGTFLVCGRDGEVLYRSTREGPTTSAVYVALVKEHAERMTAAAG